MNYVDLHGRPVSKARLDVEMANWKHDKLNSWMPKRMSFLEYVGKYLGWKSAWGRAS
jgi:hypothetical protein